MLNLKSFEILLLLLIMLFASSQGTTGSALQPTQPQYNQRYAKVFATLGMRCRCCDGEENGEKCRKMWEGSCSKLHCLPWKYHQV